MSMASPMVATESVLFTSAIDASEGCDVEAVDVPDEFITADMDEDIYLILDEPLAELMENN